MINGQSPISADKAKREKTTTTTTILETDNNRYRLNLNLILLVLIIQPNSFPAPYHFPFYNPDPRPHRSISPTIAVSAITNFLKLPNSDPDLDCHHHHQHHHDDQEENVCNYSERERGGGGGGGERQSTYLMLDIKEDICTWVSPFKTDTHINGYVGGGGRTKGWGEGGQ